MNLFRLFDTLADHDGEFFDRIADRRATFRHFNTLGRRAGVAGLGVFLGTMLQKAYGGTRDTNLDAVRNTVAFALQLERAELGLYTQAQPIVTANKAAFDTIFANETGHVAALEATARTLGLDPTDMTVFPMQVPDLTGSTNGTTAALVPDALTNELSAISVLQASEEAGGRAYRGNAYALMTNAAVLKAALQIHTVEARHAAHWKMVRGQNAWIASGDLAEGNGKVPAMVYSKVGTPANGLTYPAESNTSQGGLEASSYTTLGNDRVAEAFDEGLDPAAVTALTMPFGFKPPVL